MREKRPRISINRSQVDGPKQSDPVIGRNDVSEGIEVKIVAKGRLPDIEIDDLQKKQYYEPSGIINYQIESDVNQSHDSNDWQSNTSDNSTFLKDIYNTIDYDHTI